MVSFVKTVPILYNLSFNKAAINAYLCNGQNVNTSITNIKTQMLFFDSKQCYT